MATAEVFAPGEASPGEESSLSVADLVRMFEESEDATNEARQLSERDRDYVDNKQLSAAEMAVLTKRGQPPQIDNRIKTKVDYLVGLEKQQRIDPKALPRTPIHETDADGATQALRYVAEEQDFDAKRSGVWRNLLVEGAGGISVSVEPDKGYGPNGEPELCIKLRRVAWDRMFWDPHSSEGDFSDAGYLGLVVWRDYDDALADYPDGKDALDTTMATAPSDTYDDKPKFNHWADKKRKRVRICQIWIKRNDEWHFAEFTKGGILKAGPSPYVNDQGESDCELFFQSAYVDRDNNRYGLVREMITLQDGINKRLSKTLHLLNTAQIVMEEGALSNLNDIETVRKEAAKPDGIIVVAPSNDGIDKKFQFNTRTDLAEGHFKLLQEAKNSIDLKGPNATQMGDKAQGSSSASGRAIVASQQGGMISLGDLLDNLRHLDKRVFRAVWNRIRQFWTAEKWVRITDDERNIKWVGMNLDPEKMQQMQMQMQQNPEAAQKIGGLVASVAELDCDIIIDEVPDVIASQEQFAMLVDLKKMDVNNELPFRALVVASSIKDKSKMLDEMDKARAPNPMAEQAQQLEMAGAMATVEETKSKTALNLAKANEAQMPEVAAPQMPEQQEPFAIDAAAADIRNTEADTELKRAQVRKVMVDTSLAPQKMQEDAQIKRAALQQRAQQARQQPNRPAA